ncbi:MAG: hypothetical protein WC612_02010 [Bdellovibrionales bacterium]
MNNKKQMQAPLYIADASGTSHVHLYAPALFLAEYADRRFMVNAATKEEAAAFIGPHVWSQNLSFAPAIPAEVLKNKCDYLYVVNGSKDVMTGYALNADDIAKGKRDGTAIFSLLKIMPPNEPAVISEAFLGQYPTRLSTGGHRLPTATAATLAL